jgi:hypothetical protein
VVRRLWDLTSLPPQLRFTSAPSLDPHLEGAESQQNHSVYFVKIRAFGLKTKAVIDVKERMEKLKAANRCYLCLNRGHHTHACSKRGKVFCSKCKREHHQSVCMDKETTTSRTGQIMMASVGRVDTSSPGFIHRPCMCLVEVTSTGQDFMCCFRASRIPLFFW